MPLPIIQIESNLIWSVNILQSKSYHQKETTSHSMGGY